MNIPKQKTVDVYRETFGFRSVNVSKDQIFVNDKPFYCAGFGMHEDFEIIGRGFSLPVLTKDLNMLEWMNGNCYRTSHYPYSEERAYEADRRGIVVIAETPAVALQSFSENTLNLHKQMLIDLFKRDHRHPSIIIWSLANEPVSSKNESRGYFGALVDLIHSLDKSRPVTAVLAVSVHSDVIGDLLDLICVNRYYGWYINHGNLESINGSLSGDIITWKQKYNKPMILSEYGADTLIGMSNEPNLAFTEQYQVELLYETGKTIDFLKKKNFLTGEMIWNFADFMTAQSTIRVAGNHKGVLTRNRQPKMAAYFLKKRYGKIVGTEMFRK
uniref:Glycoside hydrolase family 2 catalytic domain-containing protein n=1 Tax=Panagrolaimus sp. JU765 TaxID=591449 RepID=A0AC34Q511_9BILA